MPFPRRPVRRALLGTLAATAAAVVPAAVVVGTVALGGGAAGSVTNGAGASYSASELGIEVSRDVTRRGDSEQAAGSTDAAGAASAAPVIEPQRSPEPPPGSFITPGERLGIAGCDLFPRDNAFRASIGALAVHPDSAEMIEAGGGSTLHLNAGFSARPWQGSRPGYPVNVADSRNSEVVSVVGRHHASTSDLEDHPVPVSPRFEGWPGITWDRHLLVVDPATCTSHEMIGVSPPGDNPLGAWFVDKAVTIDLSSNAYRPRGSVKVAGTSMLAGLVRYDEVASGRVGHVVTMSIPTARSGEPVWPARGSDGPNADPDAPPMGAWLRLRDDVDLSELGPQARTIALALQQHGGVLADTGARFAISGEPDVRWDDADLQSLRSLTLASFEVVDPSPMILDRGTLRIR